MGSVNIPGNANYAGTVSASLFVSNQVLIAPISLGTTSTLSIGSLTSTFLSTSTLSVSSLSAASGVLGSITTAGSLTGVNNPSPANTLDVIGSVFFTQRDISGGSLPVILSSTYTANDSTFGRKIRYLSSYNNGTTTASGFVDQGLTRDGTAFFINSPNTTAQGLTLLGTLCGINNAAPTYTLDVAGSARVSSSLLTNTLDGSTGSSNMFYFAPAGLSHIWYIGAGSAGNAVLFNTNGIYPAPDNVFNLGTSGQRWKNGYLSGSLTLSNGNGILNGRNMQCGQVTASQGAYITVTFPYAFANTPIVVASCAEAYAAPSTTYSFCTFCTNITTTNFQFIANYTNTGSSTINQSGNKFNWIAISPTG